MPKSKHDDERAKVEEMHFFNFDVKFWTKMGFVKIKKKRNEVEMSQILIETYLYVLLLEG